MKSTRIFQTETFLLWHLGGSGTNTMKAWIHSSGWWWWWSRDGIFFCTLDYWRNVAALSSIIADRVYPLVYHVTKIKSLHFIVFKWSPQTPHLNLTERGKFGSRVYSSMDQYGSIWTKVSQQCFQHVVSSMPWRLKAVLLGKVRVLEQCT